MKLYIQYIAKYIEYIRIIIIFFEVLQYGCHGSARSYFIEQDNVEHVSERVIELFEKVRNGNHIERMIAVFFL